MKLAETKPVLLTVGFIITVVSLIGAFTPLHWEIEKALIGVQDEYYPEYTYLFLGLPIGFLLFWIGTVTRLNSKE